MTEEQEGCVKPSKGPIAETARPPADDEESMKEATKMIARIGKPAPDFEAAAYVDGNFKNIKLSDYRGKWVVLCFYPGDFTFV